MHTSENKQSHILWGFILVSHTVIWRTTSKPLKSTFFCLFHHTNSYHIPSVAQPDSLSFRNILKLANMQISIPTTLGLSCTLQTRKSTNCEHMTPCLGRDVSSEPLHSVHLLSTLQHALLCPQSVSVWVLYLQYIFFLSFFTQNYMFKIHL